MIQVSLRIRDLRAYNPTGRGRQASGIERYSHGGGSICHFGGTIGARSGRLLRGYARFPGDSCLAVVQRSSAER